MPNLTEDLSGRIYDHLVENCGATPYHREDFINAFTQTEYVPKEWRFCGHYGLAGKFWWNNDKFYVSGFSPGEISPEEYKEQQETLEPINKVMAKFYEEHKAEADKRFGQPHFGHHYED